MSKGKDIRMDDASFSKKLQKKPKKEKIKISLSKKSQMKWLTFP